MKSILKGLIICLFSAISFIATAQTDTTGYDVYDVIYLKKGGILKGEIMSFDEPTGGIVFKDLQGRTYSFSREEYSYFKENQVFERKKKKTLVLLPRKENEFEFGIGLSANFLVINEDFTADDYYVSGSNGTADMPLCLDLNVGKYFERKHYIGATADIALSTSGKYFAAGARYMHQYDGYKKNVGFYIPIELKYARITNDLNYFSSDTTFTPGGGYSWPSQKYVELNMSTVMFSIGQGFAFILQDKKSLMFEVSIFKHFVTSHSFTDEALDPKATFTAGGLRIGAKFNF